MSRSVLVGKTPPVYAAPAVPHPTLAPSSQGPGHTFFPFDLPCWIGNCGPDIKKEVGPYVHPGPRLGPNSRHFTPSPRVFGSLVLLFCLPFGPCISPVGNLILSICPWSFTSRLTSTSKRFCSVLRLHYRDQSPTSSTSTTYRPANSWLLQLDCRSQHSNPHTELESRSIDVAPSA